MTDEFILKLYLLLFDPNRKVFVSKDFGLIRKNHFKIRGLNKFLKFIKFGNFLFIEQNPYKMTTFAKRALKGEKIAWLIDLKNNLYLARVENGKIIHLKRKI